MPGGHAATGSREPLERHGHGVCSGAPATGGMVPAILVADHVAPRCTSTNARPACADQAVVLDPSPNFPTISLIRHRQSDAVRVHRR